MRKRLTAVLLCLCMMLTLLPTPAYAAVRELVGNPPEKNQALLEELEALTGQDGEAVLELLEAYGLLDEDGNLITDQTVILNGAEYTLEEIEAMLDDPATDLSEVGYVGSTPIALGDLKTIIAIERALQRIEELYFSGTPFEGESLDNLNSLMAQIQASGITLNVPQTRAAGSGTRVANVGSIDTLSLGGSGTADIDAKAGDTLSVTVTYQPGILAADSVTVSLGSSNATLTSSNSSTTLSYNVTQDDTVKLTVTVSDKNSPTDYVYGELTGAVQLTNPQGFVFQSSSGSYYYPAHTVLLSQNRTPPVMYTSVGGYSSPHSEQVTVSEDNNKLVIPFVSVDSGFGGFDVSSSYKGNIGIDGFNREIQILQGARNETYQQQFTVSTRVDTLNENTQSYSYYAKVTDSNYAFTPGGDRTILSHFTGDIGGGMSYTMQTSTGNNAVPTTLTITEPYKDVSGAPSLPITIAQLYLQGCNVVLTDDNTAPELISATAPAGTYYPGQRIPITLEFDEFVMAHDQNYTQTGSVSCNNHGSKSFKDEDLHMNARGNKITFWYTVQQVDNTELSITKCTGDFQDLWSNKSAEINSRSIDGVTIESALMRNAVTSASASYDEDAQTATVSITLDPAEAYETKYAGYDEAQSAELRELPFRAVVTDATGAETTHQLYIINDGESFATNAFSIPRTGADQSFTVTIQANEGTQANQNWVDLSYNSGLTKTLTVPALIQASKVTVSDNSGGNYTLSLAGYNSPVLTATVYGQNGTTLATHQTGTWSSSDPSIATISNGEDGAPTAGTVVLTGQQVGAVTFTFTADNGTSDEGDDVTGTSQTYTVVPGENLALSIPGGAARILVQQGNAASVLWNSNAKYFVTGKEFQFTIELFEGNYTTEDQLAEAVPKVKYDVPQTETSFLIPKEELTKLSVGSEPAYTVRVSMPHPNVSGDDSVELSALTWIVVQAEPATASLERPENLYVTDGGTLDIQWTLENYTDQEATLTIWRVQEDTAQTVICEKKLSGEPTDGTLSGTYSLELQLVKDGSLKDTYQIMLSVENGELAAPSSDSFPLYVYNGDALQIVNSQGDKIDSLTLDNTSKVSNLTGSTSANMSTSDILAMRQSLGLLDYIGINYGDYSWNSFRDGIKWATTNDAIAINYKQGSLYENIKNFSMTSYLPGLLMGISSVEGGTATITATHAATGTMQDSIVVTANTLRNKFYLFQATPAVTTTVRYEDGNGNARSVTTNSEGVLALYEPNGINSDVWLSSKSGNTEYMGTIYLEDVQSGERDATKLQLYPLNSIRLREAAKAELTFVQSNGKPLANTTVQVRGGVYKNGYYCENSGIGTGFGQMKPGGATQTDTAFKTDANGKITVYFDATQFWSKEAGESAGKVLDATDIIHYALEIHNIQNNTYYPVFQVINSNVSLEREMQTAAGVVVLETVPEGEANKPFVARQAIDYGVSSGVLLDVRHSTGHVGPSTTYQQADLITTMLLWGETGEASSYSLTITDENGYAPAAQVKSSTRYPFASIPVVENVLTLSAKTMTDSGWIADGKDVGLKTRLAKDDVLLQERNMSFRAMDLTRVTPVNKDENVTQVLLTMKNSSALQTSVDMGDVGGSSILKALNGRLDDLAGPVESSIFKMLITPSKDPTVFNALIWAGYDTLGLEDVEFTDGVGISGNFMAQELKADVPGVGDIGEMAKGTYDPASTFKENKTKGSNSEVELGLELTGYYEAEIRYNGTTGKWEVFTKGGGFTAGIGIGFKFSVNAWVGPVPVTGTFGVGGAVQLEFKAASRYSQQTDPNDNALLEWSNPNAAGVTDFLTNLRVNAYVEAFGGVGFDYSVVALKIGLFGRLDANLQNRALSRTYLKNAYKQQQSGQNLSISGEVGIKFVAKFLFISYEAVLASGKAGAGWSFNDWTLMEKYWNSATTGLSAQSLQYEAAANGLRVASSTATLQSRDYLETYARTWGQPMRLFASLFSVDDQNGVEDLQTNANPASFPELSDDGQVLVYISDSGSSSIYNSAAHYSILSNGSYPRSNAIPGPDDFPGYGDSDADVAGTKSFAVAAWVRMNEKLTKDAGADVTLAEQNLLTNSTEIVVSVYNGSGWTSTRLTKNATPDLAPVVATNGNGKAIVFWRSVYNGALQDEKDLLDFSTQDYIMYSVYDNNTGWSEARMLYNGANASIKALQAAMLPDGNAIAVYTLDRSQAGNTSTYEIGYTTVGSDGTLGKTMNTISDDRPDENPQVIAANFGTDDRFVIGWYSTRDDGTGDIQLAAVNKEGVMSNAFPASLSELTTTGQATVNGNFRFATLSGSNDGVEDLTIIWSEQVDDEVDASTGLAISAHSVLKAAKFLPDGETYRLTAALGLAELGEDTLTDHFSAYVSGNNEVKAVIQATRYDQNNSRQVPDTNGGTVTVPGEEVMLYTATSNFQNYAVEVEDVYPDYENLMANSPVAVQFTVRNTGLQNLTDLTITMASGETAALSGTLKPNESTILTVYHSVGDEVENQSYTVSGKNLQTVTDTVYLDYPDVGISRMEVLKEEAGQRTISVTLYNSSDASLAGKSRKVQLAFYTDNQLTEEASVIYNGTTANTITISDDADLRRIDEGSFTVEVTYDVKSYVTVQGQEEIPEEGVYLYADVCTMGTIGTQSDSKRLPEFRSSDNQAAVHITGAYARTGKQSTLDVVQNNGTVTTAIISLRNNTLTPLTTQTLMAVLLDENGQPLETQNTGIGGELDGETSQSKTITFNTLGSSVAVYAFEPEQDSLIFEGLPVSLDNFKEDETGALVYRVSGISANGTLVTAVSGTGGEVVINGTASTRTGSVYVPIGMGETTITVSIGEKTYILYVTSTHSSGGSSVTKYDVTVGESENGTVTANPVQASTGFLVTITAKPDEGYRLGSLTVTRSNGSEVTVRDAGNGKYTFTMPASAVTIEATFVPIDPEALPFVDVSTDAYYYDAVDWAVSNGITNGTSDTMFSPNNACTRAQMVTFLWRSVGCPEPSGSSNLFTDVAESAYYYDAVLWAVEQGITNGTTATTFSPNATVTRGQTVTFLWRFAGAPAVSDTSFADVAGSAYYATAVAWAASEGITSGTTATTFSPNNPCTRAQIVTFLYRAQ